MSFNSKLPSIIFGIIVLSIVGFRYYDYVLEHDFTIYANTACSPGIEQCFELDCSPEEDPGCPLGPYKKVELRSTDAPKCLEEHTCENFVCGDIESCSVTYCEPSSVEEGETCSTQSETL